MSGRTYVVLWCVLMAIACGQSSHGGSADEADGSVDGSVDGGTDANADGLADGGDDTLEAVPCEAGREPMSYTITVNADGTFTPDTLEVCPGDTVEWAFGAATDTIIPIEDPAVADNVCTAFVPYDPSDANDFTGPPVVAPSGIFTLGPVDHGNLIESSSDPEALCPPEDRLTTVGDVQMCPMGEVGATMTETWESPDLTGVFIRLEWNALQLGPDTYDWSILDREIGQAVANGRVYSLAIKAGANGTPEWMFDADIMGADAVVTRVTLQDSASSPECNNPPCCGVLMDLGSPADPNYRALYFGMLQAVAEHILANNAWYRALGYIKPSGANLFTHEARLPKRCECGCDICNPEVWATVGDYTPEALYDFYSEQTALLAALFPDKSMAYQLIQDGFPEVASATAYEACPPLDPAPDLPEGTEQTETIIDQGSSEHGLQFVVQHNGLGPMPQDREPPAEPCPQEGVHPIEGGPYGDHGCPNRWVLRAGAAGQITGFQTNNEDGVADPIELDSALRNAWENSDAIFVEVYEQRFWEAETAGPVLDPDGSGLTLGEWAERFHERRAEMWEPEGLPNPFPMQHAHTFAANGASEAERFYYVNATLCGDEGAGSYGLIVLRAE